MKRIIILMLVFVYAFTVSTRANALAFTDFNSTATQGWKSGELIIASDGTTLSKGAGEFCKRVAGDRRQTGSVVKRLLGTIVEPEVP